MAKEMFIIQRQKMTFDDMLKNLEVADEKAAAAAKFTFNDGEIITIDGIYPVVVDSDKPNELVVMPVTTTNKLLAWGNFCNKVKTDITGNDIGFDEKSPFEITDKVAILKALAADKDGTKFHQVRAKVKRLFTLDKSGHTVPTRLTRFEIIQVLKFSLTFYK